MFEVREHARFFAGLVAIASCGNSGSMATATSGGITAGSSTSIEGSPPSTSTGDLSTESDTESNGAGTGEAELDCEPVGVDRIELPEEGLVVERPEQLLQFCGVREIEGNLLLDSDDRLVDWRGLAALASLEVFDGGLTLGRIDEQVSLPSLGSVGTLRLGQGKSVAPPLLPRLRAVGMLVVGSHSAPVDLSRLESARYLEVEGEMILEALTELYTFSVDSSVAYLPQAPQLERISGDVEIQWAQHLTDLALLRNVRAIEGRLDLSNLPALESLSDLSALERVGTGEVTGTESPPLTLGV